MEVLTSGTRNTQCLYHFHGHTKDQNDQVGSKKQYQATGTPCKPVTIFEKPDTGFMNCGCESEYAVMELYFNKTGTIMSRKKGPDGTVLDDSLQVRESWLMDRLQPRERVLMFKQFKEETKWDLDSIWTKKWVLDQNGIGLVDRSTFERSLKFISRILGELPHGWQDQLKAYQSEVQLDLLVAGPADVM